MSSAQRQVQADRRMQRALHELTDAAQAGAAAREAEEQAANAEASGPEQRLLRNASRILRDVSAHGVGRAGRIADGFIR